MKQEDKPRVTFWVAGASWLLGAGEQRRALLETFINIGDYRPLISIALYDINNIQKLKYTKNKNFFTTTQSFFKNRYTQKTRRWSALSELFHFPLRIDPSLELHQEHLRDFLALSLLCRVFSDRITEFLMKTSKQNSTKSIFGRIFTKLELKWSSLKTDGKSEQDFYL